MAKRSHNRARQPPKCQQVWTKSTPTVLPSTPRRVALAHAKHTVESTPALEPDDPIRPTLADRFYALPTELRALIFSFVLVRNIKWELPHHKTCSLSHSNIDPAPEQDEKNYTCARCEFPSNGFWRHAHHEGWMNPWRSKWAPERSNIFLCSDCWDAEFRPLSFPLPRRSEKCICARREGLETLLVCRRWYEEAGHVFYSRNTFTFEACSTFVAFILLLPQRWWDAITRVSILFERRASADPTQEDSSVDWDTRFNLSHTWSYLRQLSSLSYLELDAAFLTRVDTVKSMLRLGLRHTRQVNFVLPTQRRRDSILRLGSEHIWPQFRRATLLVGGFAEDVARAIKGQRCEWLKDRKALANAVDMERSTPEDVCASSSTPGIDVDGYLRDLREHVNWSAESGCYECDEWRGGWWKSWEDHLAYIEYHRYVDRGDDWRVWRPRNGNVHEVCF